MNLKKLYKENIYGVMGTLVFHILLVGSFLLSEVNLKGETGEEAIMINLADLKEEILEKQEDKHQEQGQEQEDKNTPFI
ncbi:MAG: hypothetical protein AB2L24_23335 [Mangrovibacterium sp.]